MVMPELVFIVKRKVVIRLKNRVNGMSGVMDDGVMEGSRFRMYQRTSTYSFQSEEGRTMGLNRRLPQITQRDVLPNDRFDYSISRAKDKPCVETFAGAACLTKLVAIHAPREKTRGPSGASQSGSPPIGPA